MSMRVRVAIVVYLVVLIMLGAFYFGGNNKAAEDNCITFSNGNGGGWVCYHGEED